MVDIICAKEQSQDILAWMRAKDTEMFGDVEREDYSGTGVDPTGVFKAADGHAGIFDLTVKEDRIESDCHGYIVYSRGHLLDEEIINYYASLKKEFPSVELHGSFAIGLSDDDWVSYSIEATAEDNQISFEDLGWNDDEDDE